MKNCPYCRSDNVEVVSGVINHSFVWRGVSHHIPMHSQECRSCKFSFTSGRLMDINFKKWRDYIDALDGYISTSDILTIREYFDLSLSEMDTYYNLEVGTWEMWESGKVEPSDDEVDWLQTEYEKAVRKGEIK